MGFKLIWHDRGVTKQYFGILTGDDILDSVQQVEADERFDDLRYTINDFTGIDDVLLESFSPDLVDMVAAIDKAAYKANPNIRIPIVTTHADVERMAKQYAESDLNVYPTKIVSTLDAAYAWLGIAPLAF
jgi:hypothetical protein